MRTQSNHSQMGGLRALSGSIQKKHPNPPPPPETNCRNFFIHTKCQFHRSLPRQVGRSRVALHGDWRERDVMFSDANQINTNAHTKPQKTRGQITICCVWIRNILDIYRHRFFNQTESKIGISHTCTRTPKYMFKYFAGLWPRVFWSTRSRWNETRLLLMLMLCCCGAELSGWYFHRSRSIRLREIWLYACVCVSRKRCPIPCANTVPRLTHT